MGLNPLIWDNLHFPGMPPSLTVHSNSGIFGQTGTNYTLLASTGPCELDSYFKFHLHQHTNECG